MRPCTWLSTTSRPQRRPNEYVTPSPSTSWCSNSSDGQWHGGWHASAEVGIGCSFAAQCALTDHWTAMPVPIALAEYDRFHAVPIALVICRAMWWSVVTLPVPILLLITAQAANHNHTVHANALANCEAHAMEVWCSSCHIACSIICKPYRMTHQSSTIHKSPTHAQTDMHTYQSHMHMHMRTPCSQCH